MKKLEFYFDYISPFSYFAWLKLAQLKDKYQLDIELYPVTLGNLLNHWQIKGPGEVQPKREFLLKTCLRYARRNNLEFTTPKTHPFNPLYALRMSLKSNAGELQWKVIDCLWKAGWQKRIDMADPDQLVAQLEAVNLPGKVLLERSFDKNVKQELKENVARALNHQVFGVPSFIYNHELFWGNDSIDDLKLCLENNDPLDREKFQQLLDSTPRAAGQKI